MTDVQFQDNPYGNPATEEEMARALEQAAANPVTVVQPGAPANAKAPKAPKAPKVPAAPVDPGICLCGCGQPKRSAKARFIPGHDAKAKSQLLKVERGQATIDTIAPELLAYVQITPMWAQMFPKLFAPVSDVPVELPVISG